jgi:hypothetical protein
MSITVAQKVSSLSTRARTGYLEHAAPAGKARNFVPSNDLQQPHHFCSVMTSYQRHHHQKLSICKLLGSISDTIQMGASAEPLLVEKGLYLTVLFQLYLAGKALYALQESSNGLLKSTITLLLTGSSTFMTSS